MFRFPLIPWRSVPTSQDVHFERLVSLMESLEMKKARFSKLIIASVSSISEEGFSLAGNTVTSKRASLNSEKVEDKVLICGWVGSRVLNFTKV